MRLKSVGFWLGAILSVWVVAVFIFSSTFFNGSNLVHELWHPRYSLAGGREVLVMYLFAASDPEYLDNLKFFVAEAVIGDQRCDYVIILQDYKADEVCIHTHANKQRFRLI